MSIICSECHNKVKLGISSVTNHSRSNGDGSYTIAVVAECGCEEISPQATSIDKIEFLGNPPDGWT